MKISFLAPDLRRWAAVERDPIDRPEALVLPFFSDERPLRGAAGLCDWRLCGRLSRLLIGGRLEGAAGETTLYPPGPRLPFPRLLLLGLGGSESFGEEGAREAIRRLLAVTERMGLERFAAVLPGRSTGRVSARRSVELLLEESEGAGTTAEVAVVESPAGQKEAAELVRR